jgi:hypothetical protein
MTLAGLTKADEMLRLHVVSSIIVSGYVGQQFWSYVRQY